MAEDLIETCRNGILNQRAADLAVKAIPQKSNRKEIDSWNDMGVLAKVDESFHPVHNILVNSKNDSISKEDYPIYLFIDVNYQEANVDMVEYQKEFQELVESRIQTASSNNSDKNFNLFYLALHVNSGRNDEDWQKISRKMKMLKSGSRVYIYDKKIEVSKLHKVGKLELSSGVILDDLLNLLNPGVVIETIGLFSNTFQGALLDSKEMLTELRAHVAGKTKVMLLPASKMPMTHNLNFERAGVIESLVVAHSKGGDHHDWIESSQEKLVERIPVFNRNYTNREVAISTTTFLSMVLDMPNRKNSLAMPDAYRSVSKTTIRSIDEHIGGGDVRFDFELCSSVQAELTTLMQRSLHYLMDYFEKKMNDKELRAVLFASLLTVHHNVNSMLKQPEIILRRWKNLLNSERPNNLIGRQTMTDKTKRKKEGVVIGRWCDMTQKWRGTTRSKRVIIKILKIVSEGDFDPESAMDKWNEWCAEIVTQKKNCGPSSQAMFGILLLDKKVCEAFQEFWSAIKRVTHGGKVPKPVMGPKNDWKMLYLEKKDKRYINHNIANKLINNLRTELERCGWEDPLSRLSEDCEYMQELEWWNE